ncbi:protein-glutamate O-methyltransferase CheR [Mariprofundus sp. KV]|uniref:CheR family methyltransferase n=1 Tax=Mariprofundus sp. KV TaxID=2608715 RepID=UPI0015A413EB|nr:protein-glutamate O-methyltransferase CheR [Mariprofundus sp. KV]NWF37098.1 protein-glutamate O-methyltransferase CheR [Mariprofundus sp. KV]
MTISTDRITFITDFLKREIGLALDESKLYLIRARLLPVIRQHGINSLDALIDEVKKNERCEIAKQVVDRMTTNETLFFRDKYPFEALKNNLLSTLVSERPGFSRIKIWSAAASTGQEAYSIAMTALQTLDDAANKVSILGTDISSVAIAAAKEGVYKQMEVRRGLAIQDLANFFKQRDEHSWQVKDELKAMVKFQEANLISPSLVTNIRHYSLFDIVFCRNVLIYFDLKQRMQVIDHIAQLTQIGGYLFTGAGEMVQGQRSVWETVRIENRPVWRLVSK